jgi:hypothetical protein
MLVGLQARMYRVQPHLCHVYRQQCFTSCKGGRLGCAGDRLFDFADNVGIYGLNIFQLFVVAKLRHGLLVFLGRMDHQMLGAHPPLVVGDTHADGHRVRSDTLLAISCYSGPPCPDFTIL